MDDRDASVTVASAGPWDSISNKDAINIVHGTGAHLQGIRELGLPAL